jgi:hypothetical protein
VVNVLSKACVCCGEFIVGKWPGSGWWSPFDWLSVDVSLGRLAMRSLLRGMVFASAVDWQRRVCMSGGCSLGGGLHPGIHYFMGLQVCSGGGHKSQNFWLWGILLWNFSRVLDGVNMWGPILTGLQCQQLGMDVNTCGRGD